MSTEKQHSDKIIKALDKIAPAIPDIQFLKSLEKVALKYAKGEKPVSKQTVLSIAASLILLVSANAYTVFSSMKVDNSDNEATTLVYSINTLIPSQSIYHD